MWFYRFFSNLAPRQLWLFLTVATIFCGLCAALVTRYTLNQRVFPEKIRFYQASLETMYKRQAQNLPDGSILFFGDSHIQGLAVTAISPLAVNFGIGHQQLKHLAVNIKNYPGISRAKKIIIGIGVNDLLHQQHAELYDSIPQLLAAIDCCRDKVLLLGLMPINEQILGRTGLNQQISTFNLHLQQTAYAADIAFLDLYKVFSDPAGQLVHTFDLGDGLHLSQAGYQVLIQQLQQVIVKERNLNES